MASAARNLVSRSIHVKIHPAPRSFPERREVLRVLERFGEVEIFKSLKYDQTNPVPNAFLSILSTEEAAQAALDASPIRYRLVAELSPSPSLHSSLDGSSPLTPASSSPSSASTSGPQREEESIFELRISPSTYPHSESIASSPLYSTFDPISPHRSPIASDLSSRIPDSIAKPGLIDWVTDSARMSGGWGARVGRKKDGGDEGRIQWGRGGGVGWEETKPWRLREKERVEREKDVPWILKGLRSRP